MRQKYIGLCHWSLLESPQYRCSMEAVNRNRESLDLTMPYTPQRIAIQECLYHYIGLEIVREVPLECCEMEPSNPFPAPLRTAWPWVQCRTLP